MPENLTTLAHLSVSAAMCLPKSAGELANTVAPLSAKRALILGSARMTLTSLLSLSTMSAGVFLGAPMPSQPLRLVARHEFAHGRDVRQGFRTRRGGHRSARTLPALMCSITEAMVSNITCACPLNRSVRE